MIYKYWFDENNMINGARIDFKEGDDVLYLNNNNRIPEWLHATVIKTHLSYFNGSVIQVDLKINSQSHDVRDDCFNKIHFFKKSIMYPFFGVATYKRV